MWLSLGIISMSLTLFAFVITLVFDAVLFENVDELLNQELIQYQLMLGMSESAALPLDYFISLDDENILIEEYLVPEILLDNGYVGANFVEAATFPNPKIMTYIYYNDVLIYSTNAGYFKQMEPHLSKETTNGMINFKQNGFSFRGQTLKKDDVIIQTIMNIDSEMGAKYSLYQVIGISFLVLIMINVYFVQKLIAVVFKPVEKSYQLQTQFIQDVSHEMRTPLTILKGQAELLMKRDTSPEHQDVLLANMITEISDMQKLQRDLLVLSKVDVDNSLEITEVDLFKLINELEEMYGLLAEFEDKQFRVELNVKNAIIMSDASKVKQCLSILLDNAFKYTAPQDEIVLILEEQKRSFNLKVQDNGLGIGEKEIPHIFNRFYRSAQEQIQNIEGNGIGLSILKAFCEQLNYKVNVSSKLGIGTTFEIKIPKKD